MNDVKELALKFREAADILDEFAVLEEKEKAGENTDEECATLLGKFMFKVIELQAIQNKL